MAKIKVELPFSVRMEGEAELLAFTPGVHEVEEDVLGHWFVQACIKEGRAILLGDALQKAESEAPAEPLTEEVMRAMANKTLIKMAKDKGLDVPDKATKDQLVALLMGDKEEK